jgi:hypothetical protein
MQNNPQRSFLPSFWVIFHFFERNDIMDANCFLGTLLVMSLAACCTYHSRLETDFEAGHKKTSSDSDLHFLLEDEGENNSIL